ncbi:MAG: TrkA family potassium uptake protein [Eubacterium sp.]|nr:TrkA family potassium uptake protein [Eubacterium sp.]MCI6995918.1 TrkA family potassium uptake protein [Eubacterium sp.]MDY2595893.1 TrkA family potassium uptake protein [Oliverpabstia sp.]
MKNVLIIGLGRFGRHMAKKFIEEGNDVLAVEISEERADSAIEIVQNIQIGDATDERFIQSLGVDNFDLCVIAIGDRFQVSLEITVLLKDMGAPYVIARASRDIHKKLLLRNGADYVVYGERELAERLAVKFGADNIFDYIVLDSEYAIYEIAVPRSWYGKSIVELSIRNKYKVSILATKKDGRIYPLPHPEHIFSPDETLMVMGNEESIKVITR